MSDSFRRIFLFRSWRIPYPISAPPAATSDHGVTSRCSHKKTSRQGKTKSQREALQQGSIAVPSTGDECYECFVCGDDLPLQDGVVVCYAHFICNNCAVRAFSLAVHDQTQGMFPAKCCTPLPRRLFEDVVPRDILDTYKNKCVEYYTPLALRVYCAGCGEFVSLASFRDDYWHTVAECKCGKETCVGCKKEWEERHLCDIGNDAAQPDWLPEYSDDCRIKRCPACRMWIEHRDACNHMTCSHCKYQFCFICLVSWKGTHNEAGCPIYGEPMVGYDEEGYEFSSRAIHRQTGLNREGNDLYGLPPSSHIAVQLANSSAQGGGDWGYLVYGEDGEDDPYFEDVEIDDNEGEDDEGDDDESDEGESHGGESGHYPYGRLHEETVLEGWNPERSLRAIQMQTSDWRRLYQCWPVPYCAGDNFSFTAIDYGHEWDRQPVGDTSCVICFYAMYYYSFECQLCRMRVCEWCTRNFKWRLNLFHPDSEQRLTLIQMAEQGRVPFKEERRRQWIDFQNRDSEWNIDTMFEAAEEDLYAAQPFLYHDFGLAAMFATAESELGSEYRYDVVENVGVPGCTFSFRADSNQFMIPGWPEDQQLL